MIYSTMPHGLYCTFTAVLGFGNGNVVCSLIVALFIYILVEHPFTRIIQWTCLSRLSHDTVLHKQFMKEEKEANMYAESFIQRQDYV
jgi:hypothetical protein